MTTGSRRENTGNDLRSVKSFASQMSGATGISKKSGASMLRDDDTSTTYQRRNQVPDDFDEDDEWAAI
jgi:hypothetical protein